MSKSARTRGFALAARILGSRSPQTRAVVWPTASAIAEVLGGGVIVHLVQGDGLRPVAVAHVNGTAELSLRVYLNRSSEVLVDAFAIQVRRTGQPILLPTVTSRLMMLWTNPAYHAYLHEHPVQTLLAVPCLARDKLMGAINVWREQDGVPFDDSDVVVVFEVARRIALEL